jgi:hypothetical protein
LFIAYETLRWDDRGYTEDAKTNFESVRTSSRCNTM